MEIKKKRLTNQYNVSAVELPLLVKLKIDLVKKRGAFLFGFGILSAEDKNDKLISLNAGIIFWFELIQPLRLFTEIRAQTAGSLQTGGGDSINSLIFGGGIQIKLNN